MSTVDVVLVALDGSRESAKALPLASAIAEQLHARIAAIFVAAAPPPAGEDARARARLDSDDWRDVDLVVHKGEPSAVILAELEKRDRTLLVMTCSAAGKPVRGVGSVAMNVIANATRPIVVLRPEIAPAARPGGHRIARLLVPLDGTIETAAALRPVAQLARQLGAHAEVLYVARASGPAEEQRSIAGRRYVDQPQHEWASWRHEIKERLVVESAGFAPSADVRICMCHGDPGEEIVRHAEAGGFDAIVLVRRSRLEPDRALVIRTVIERSPCPLIVVGAAV